MQVTAIDTGRSAKLEIIDSNGVNYAQDSIGNCGGLWNGEDSIKTNDDDEFVVNKDENLKFWESFCGREQASSDGLEVARSIGLDSCLELFNGLDGDIEKDQFYFLSAVKDALEDGELLCKLEISKSEAEEAHNKITDLLDRECFK